MLTLHRRTLLRLGAAASLSAAPLAGAGRATARAAFTGPIDEQGFVRIGGIDQWIGIQGPDVSRPAILYLHGGPAEAQSPFMKEFLPWEQGFTVANWDQRGSGKTYGRNGPSTPDMTLEQMTQDAIEVAEHVRQRLRKRKIILVGQSWGAALGVHVVKQRPDLFGAYVGTGQPVTWALSQESVEQYARQQLTAANDQAGLEALDDAQTLPIDDLRRVAATRQWRMAPSDLDYLKIQAPFAGLPASATGWVAGGGFSMPKLLPYVFGLDLPKLGYDFALPMFVIQGRSDHITSFAAAEDWIQHLHAPARGFIPIDGGHFACFTSATAFVAALTTQIMPYARDV